MTRRSTWAVLMSLGLAGVSCGSTTRPTAPVAVDEPTGSPATAPTNGAVSGLTMADQEALARYEARFAQAVAAFNQKCGAEMTASYDWTPEPVPRADGRPAGNGYTACEEVLSGVSARCGDAAPRATIASKVKAIRCVYEAGSSQRVRKATGLYSPELSYADGTITMVFDWGTANVSADVLEWVPTHL